MIDLDLLRQSPEVVKESLKKRGGKSDLVDRFLSLDEKWRQMLQSAEELRAKRNELTKTKELAQENSDELKEIKVKLGDLEQELAPVAEERQDAYLQIPQILDATVPVGEGESANAVIRKEGAARLEQGLAHEDLMEKLGWLDLTTASQFSGARFRYLKGAAAIASMKLMHQAIEWAIENGFTPVIPPVIAKEELLVNGGFFPGGKEDTFAVGDRFLVGTSEPLLVALGARTTFEAKDLPRRFIGFSTCFRQEAGSYGKDTKGMFRQHQFDKVEMVSICDPTDSEKEHQFLLKMQEEFVSRFNLSYQVVLIGSGDVESKATKRFDLEAWFPGQKRYRETHSVSNCGDFQARRFGIKVKGPKGEKYAHTLNGTLATERLLLAIIENSQAADGTVTLPKELR